MTKRPQDEDQVEAKRQHDSLNLVAKALQGLRYGQVTLVVQDGLIVQIERTEKMRVQQDKLGR